MIPVAVKSSPPDRSRRQSAFPMPVHVWAVGLWVMGGLLFFMLLTPVEAFDPEHDEFWYTYLDDGSSRLKLHFFWTESCPHCGEARPFIIHLPERYPWIEVISHPLTDHRENALYIEAARAIGYEARSVPGFMFCGQLYTGYHTAETTGRNLIAQLERCRDRIAAESADASPLTSISGGAQPFHLPIIGKVDIRQWSLPALTVTLAGLDAFNPCAFFVLFFLLSLLVHTRSRRRMLLVGITFVFISGFVYFAFMATWLNVFMLTGELSWVTSIAGMIALVIGFMNTRDFFFWRQGPSLSIPESAKPRLFKHMRHVVNAGSLMPMLLATIILALAANSYELLCTVGFPMVYTRALTLHDLAPTTYYGYLILYNMIYIIPLMLIVIAFSVSMGSRKLSERQGRILKLISGYMMLLLGGTLLFMPQMLMHAPMAMTLLVLALGAAWATVYWGARSRY